VRRLLPVLILALSLFVVACGGDDGGSSTEGADTTTTTATTAQVEFPSGDDKTIRALRNDLPEGAIFAPAVSVMRVGKNRIGFALFDTARKQVDPEAVALYVAQPNGRRLSGPFEATRHSLETKPQFQSRQAQADLADVNSFWTATVKFPRRGRFVVTALVQIDGKMASTSQYELRVGGGGPPDVGQKAIPVHTETPADVGGDLSQIDTRIPPLAELHEKDFADVVGKEPTVLVFATPQLCQTRVCGPVVDVAAQVRSQSPGVTFIHQEIYVDNDINKGFRPQVTQWRLPTEPWMFLIGADGLVKERFEGAVSVEELQRAVDATLKG
jgi:hypothetical protein